GAVAGARWRQVRKLRLALVLLLGTAVLYVLNALRLYGLVVIANEWSPRVSVDLAHSRIGGIAFLGISVALVAAACRPDRGAEAVRGWPPRPPPKSRLDAMYRTVTGLLQPTTLLYLLIGLALVNLWRKRQGSRRALLWVTIPFLMLTVLCIPAV